VGDVFNHSDTGRVSGSDLERVTSRLCSLFGSTVALRGDREGVTVRGF